MIFVRVKTRFRVRASEWFCAASLFLWGATVLHPSDLFTTTPAFAAFKSIGEPWTGTITAALGAAWLIGLTINGMREKLTSSIRWFCCTIGSIVYGLIAIGLFLGYLATGVLSPGIGSYVLHSFLALYALFHIVVDRRAESNGTH